MQSAAGAARRETPVTRSGPGAAFAAYTGPNPERRAGAGDRDSQESLSWWLVPGLWRRETWRREPEWGPATSTSNPWPWAAWPGSSSPVWSITLSMATLSRPLCQWPCPGGTPGRGQGSRRSMTATSISSPMSQLRPGQSGCPRWISSSTASTTSRSCRTWWEPPRTTETTLLKTPVILIMKSHKLYQLTPLLSIALKITRTKGLQGTLGPCFKLRPASPSPCLPPRLSSPRVAPQATSRYLPPPPYLRPCHTRHTMTVFWTTLMMTFLMLLLSGKIHEM